MIHIRPISDLLSKYTEIEDLVIKSNSPVFLTKNGNKTMVLLSMEQYAALIENIESELDKADAFAENSPIRRTRSEIFDKVKSRIDENSKL